MPSKYNMITGKN